jgi:SAM-dependent methyltransferase
MADYYFRPSISPLIAGLFAAGLIMRRHAVLDAGCGTGTDCLTLLSWGIRRVVGIDLDDDYYRARHREVLRAAYRLTRRNRGAQTIEFHYDPVTRRHAHLRDRSFDVVLDSLLFNNLSPNAGALYLQQVARVLKPGGLFVIQCRSSDPRFGVLPARRRLPPTFEKFFRASGLVTTDLVEYSKSRGGKRVRVTVVVARRRGRADQRGAPSRRVSARSPRG